jgi:GGDEF domain-containing protein
MNSESMERTRNNGPLSRIQIEREATKWGANRAENIRRAIEERPLETATGPLAVSMSLGVAGTEDWRDSNAEQLIKQADVALYRAEEWGPEPAKPSGLSEIRASKMTQNPLFAV